MDAVSTSSPGVHERFMHKNRLKEYAQRSALPLPVYQTMNEGSQCAPLFRSTVIVDGLAFSSSQTFVRLRESEQNVARVALEGIYRKIKQEGCPLIRVDTTFCKSILNEYAVKMNMDKPIYTCSQSDVFLRAFISTVLFNGTMYKGVVRRNKKEAEQLAACVAIESILGDCNSSRSTFMSQIIKSKRKLYDVIHQHSVSSTPPVIDVVSGGNLNVSEKSSVKQKEVQVASTNERSPTAAHVKFPLQQLAESHPDAFKRKKPKEECIEISSDSDGGGSSLQHERKGGRAAGQVTLCSKKLSNEPHVKPDIQVKIETSPAGPSGLPSEIQVTSSNRKRKYLKKVV